MEAAAALRAHGEPAATLPYTLDQITGDWLPSHAGGASKGS